jgi:predicted MFS family arabinose efflux permease
MNNNKDTLWSLSFINSCIANFMMSFSYYMLTATLPFYLTERFHANKTVTGIILSCYVISALAVRPFSGYMVDTFPRKKLYLLSFVCFVSLYFGYLLVAALIFVAIVRVLHGIAWAVITTTANTLSIDIMPPSKRGEGIGWYGLTVNLSMAIGPVAGLFMYENYPFELIFYSTIISGILGIAAAFFIKAPIKAKSSPHRPLSLDRFIQVKGIPVAINLMLITISYGMVISFAAMYGKELNISNTGVFFILLAIGIGGARVFSGRLIDRGWIHKISLIGMILLFGSFVLFTFARSSLLFFTSALLIGLGYGIMIPAFQSLFVNMATHNQLGTANSMYFTSFDLGIGLGMIAAGKIAAAYSFSHAFGFSALLNMLAVFYYWGISKGSYDKNRLDI